MYLFTRTRQVDPGKFADAIGWVGTATESVRSTTGRELDAWTAILSPELGSVTWSMWAESLAELVEAGDKLAASADWAKVLQSGNDFFVGGVEDGLASVVYGAEGMGADGPPEYVGVATASAAPGRLGDAIGAGIEIAEQVKKSTGQNTLFLINSTGLYGGVAWITPSANIGEVDASEAALAADPEFVKLIDRVGTAYNPGAAQAIFRRIA